MAETSSGNAMDVPLVSVVIPSYNHAKYVVLAVESALAQSYPALEVIVVDDGSKDDTANALKRYAGRINYVYQENKGLPAARNTGIRLAKGEFIAFLDADDEWFANKIEKQMAVILKHPEVGLVSCGSVAIDPAGSVLWNNEAHNYTDKRVFLEELATGNNVTASGSGALVRRESFLKVGLFDETLTSSEDWDMWLRIAVQADIMFVEKTLSKRRVVPGSMSSAANAGKMLENEMKVLAKLFGQENARFSRFVRRKAFSTRYMCAAWSYQEAGDRRHAFAAIVRSLLSNPIHFLLSGRYVGLLVRIMVGRRLFLR